ncbi:MAG: hypothetical protein QXG01_04760 [Candidatus Bathyarchaeia archaeon]
MSNILFRVNRFMCKIAKLTEEELRIIQESERKLNRVTLIAYEKTPEIARLTDGQLGRVKELENELKVYLLAYEKV